MSFFVSFHIWGNACSVNCSAINDVKFIKSSNSSSCTIPQCGQIGLSCFSCMVFLMEVRCALNASVSVKQIFGDNWSGYVRDHSVADYQVREVEKALGCYGFDNGAFVYSCKRCGSWVFQRLGCNGRICSCCGKRYADQWSYSLSRAMFQVSHRHFVMSIPDSLWSFLRVWDNMKGYMDAAIKALSDYFSRITHQRLKVGAIVVLHPFGKDMKFQPHLHILLTEGGFDGKGRFVKCGFVPAGGLRKKWQYEVLKELQAKGLPNPLASQMYSRYRKGFYVWLHVRGRIKHPKQIARYVGRYVRHPAIANSRIYHYDGRIVKFFYVNGEDRRVDVTMGVDQFISALIQHIPPPQFKMIRYYGAYARRVKGQYGAGKQSGIKQLNLYHFGLEKVKYCPFCRGELEFVWYCKKGPPEQHKSKKELLNWLSTS